MKLYANSLIEVEDFSLDTGFVREKSDCASGGMLVKSTTSGTASMHTTVAGRQGLYDLAVTYFDENDGSSWSRVKIDGETVDSWTWDDPNGARNAGGDSTQVRIIRDVTLDDLSRITIEGKRDGGEPLRIDSVQLLRAESTVRNSDKLAFEGAEGFGAVTQGGNNGIVVKVTNLNDSGYGSLRWALEELEFARTVVFEVGGLIELSDQIEVNGDVTVAGHTAPGGITVTGGRLRVVESDVIIQGLRIRPGDGDGQDAQERDGITIGTSERVVERVVIDSNSFTWAVDENISIWSGARDITISNNIIAEGLNNSIHPDGHHSMGLLIGDGAERITVVDNLFANNFHRNPQLIDVTKVEFVNNVIANWGNNAFHTAVREDSPIKAHVIGNVFLGGDDTSSMAPVRLRGWEEGTKYVVYDNLGPGRDAGDPEKWILDADTTKGIVHSGTAFTPSNVSISAASKVLQHVLENVGARTDGKLDAIDARIVKDVKDGDGSVVNRPPEDVEAVAKAKAGLADRDEDGIPDVYEAALGSNSNRWDANDDADGNGWSNLSDYAEIRRKGLLPSEVSELAPTASKASAPPSDVVVQAEHMTLKQGFKVASNGAADGGKLIQAGSKGMQVAETVFKGEDGVYDLFLRHFDENDGESQLSVLVNGREIDDWAWDQQNGTSNANSRSATERAIQDVEIMQGDLIELVGYRDGREPLRIDAIEFEGVAPIDDAYIGLL